MKRIWRPRVHAVLVSQVRLASVRIAGNQLNTESVIRAVIAPLVHPFVFPAPPDLRLCLGH
jgi:hypothetical protein